MRWEYKFVTYVTTPYRTVAASTQKEFAELGEGGWELVNTVWVEPPSAISIFKRPKPVLPG